jgi:hypothetical protein
MYEEAKVGWGRRITRAMMIGLLNIILYIIIPSILFSYVTSLAPGVSIPLTPDLIYTFGAVITGLQVLGALTEGMIVSIPFESGGYLAIAVYIYLAVDGGSLSLSAEGLGFAFSMQPLVFLLVLPPLYGALRTPITYLLEYHEAARAAPSRPPLVEVILHFSQKGRGRARCGFPCRGRHRGRVHSVGVR